MVDKGGGIALLDPRDYVSEMMKQHINTTHTDSNGVEHPFYEPATMSDVTRHSQDIRRVLDEGVQAKYISSSD